MSGIKPAELCKGCGHFVCECDKPIREIIKKYQNPAYLRDSIVREKMVKELTALFKKRL